MNGIICHHPASMCPGLCLRLLLVIAVAAVAAVGSQNPPPDTRIQMCGSKLVKFLRDLCNSVYKKKSVGEASLLQGGRAEGLAWPAVALEAAGGEDDSFPGQFHRLARRAPGIVNECCFRPCLISNMMQYCG
ncbi:bombyxin C-1-like [Bacillus rossius redtenbacheri]|uniref:bombyxin C-1-like n=1 Tax=Bacillus rossius redtenbacheri TaxID=93214 RepID=UPI002FDE587B